MFNVKKLWLDRSKATAKELSRYLRYMLNGHFMIVIVFLIGSLTFYYQQWVKTLPTDFPAAIIMASILSLFLTYSPIYTFLLEADRVFLLPLEKHLNRYFWWSGVVSFILQAYMLILVLAILMPMYIQVFSTSYNIFFYFLVIILVLKIWNLATRWRIQYFVEKKVKLIDTVMRYCLNAGFLYLMFMLANKILLIFLILVMVGFYYYFYHLSLKKGLKWEELIQSELNRLTSFYRIANLFTDVPKLKEKVKRRKWLDWLASRISYNKKNSQLFLLMRTFIRSGDYLGLVLRLTLIGGWLIYSWDFIYGQMIFFILFMYLTGFQLLPLKNHHQNILWVDLYPIESNQREQAFISIIRTILIAQGCIFSGVLLSKGEWLSAVIGIILALMFSFLFVRYFSVKKV